MTPDKKSLEIYLGRRDFLFGAARILKQQIPDGNYARFIFSIIERAILDAYLNKITHETYVKKARRWLKETNNSFKYYCNLLGLNEIWAASVIKKEIDLYDRWEKLKQ